jgi:hypothetical protein
MFLCPDGWREWRAGDDLLYSPREGNLHCVMRYRERVTPLRSFPKLLDEVLVEDVEFVPEERNKITRFVTDEGEYAALIVVRGTFRNRRIGHVVTAIFADDFSTLLDARVEGDFVDRYAQQLLALTKTDRLDLGVRRRRLGFKPPAGWHPIIGLALDVALLPPDYPKLHASITVNAAYPLANGIPPYEHQVLHDVHVGLGRGADTRKIAMTAGLRGEEWEMIRTLPNNGGRIVRYLVVLRDGRYTYSAKLEAFEGPGLRDLHEIFSTTVGTFEAIPQPVAQRANQSSIFEIWSD